MAAKKSIKLIMEPTRDDLVEKIKSFSKLKISIINSITSINNNLFSFLCGIITNIPISVLFSILTMKVSFAGLEIVKFIVYVLFLVSSSMLAVYSIKFTVKHIEINSDCDRISNKEIYRNCLIEKVILNMSDLLSNIYHIFVWGGISLLLIISLFVINNCA